MQKLHPLVLALPCLPLLFSLSIYQDNADSEPDPLEPYFGKYQFLLPTHPPQPAPEHQQYLRAGGQAPASSGSEVTPEQEQQEGENTARF